MRVLLDDARLVLVGSRYRLVADCTASRGPRHDRCLELSHRRDLQEHQRFWVASHRPQREFYSFCRVLYSTPIMTGNMSLLSSFHLYPSLNCLTRLRTNRNERPLAKASMPRRNNTEIFMGQQLLPDFTNILSKEKGVLSSVLLLPVTPSTLLVLRTRVIPGQQVFRVDDMGRDTVVGYGSVLIPTQAGRHERMSHMYAPQPSSMLQRLRAWVSGAYPEVRILTPNTERVTCSYVCHTKKRHTGMGRT